MSSSSSIIEDKELLDSDIEEIKEEINGDQDKPINEDIKTNDSEDDRPIWSQGKPKRPKRSRCEVEVLTIRELPKRVASKINYAEINSDEDEDEDCFFIPKPKKKIKNESSDEDESWNEDEDSDDSTKKVTKKERNNENENGSDKKPLSEYEKLLERNRAEKMAFLQSLNMNEAKDDLRQVMDSFKRKPVKKRERVEKPPQIMRKSSRLDNKTFDYSEDALYDKILQGAQANEKAIPSVMSLKEALESEELFDEFCKDINIQESKEDSKPFYYSNSVLKKLKMSELTYSKFSESPESTVRLSALAWYPSSESLILAGGCTHGNLSIQNVGTKSNRYLLKAHTKKVSNMHFNPFNPVHLVSCSHDGTMRNGDMVKQVFNEIYDISEKTTLNDFDFLTESAYVTAQGNGDVGIIDIRTSGKRYEKQHPCHESMVHRVQVHPVNKTIFMTTDKGIRLWDLRKLSKQPLVDVPLTDKGKLQAYFSPITGKYILGTSAQAFRIYDSTDPTTGIKLIREKKIKKVTKTHSSCYRACWLPNTEENFFIASNVTQRGIQICDMRMNELNIITDHRLTSMNTVCVFHPYKPAAAAGKDLHRGIFIFT